MDPLTANLFFLAGDRWKTIRTKLTPAFTSSKVKTMFPILVQCGRHLEQAMKDICTKNVKFEVKQISSCYTIDVIGSCAFGLDINSFTNPENEFVKQGEKFFSTLTQLNSLSIVLSLLNPKLAELLSVQTIPKDITDFFLRLVEDTVRQRKKEKYWRKDFMQIMIDLKKNNEVEEGLSINEMAAQSFAFFVAGYDTSSTTITFCLYEVAKHSDIQQKLREEIADALSNHNGVTYEAVASMRYLDQVINETLRKYPPVALMTRVCTEDYLVDSNRNVVIKKGTKVAVPIYAIHHDEEYYPQHNKFDPERFSDEGITKRPTFAYMPFGAGPRTCAGIRIGLLQIKVALVILLNNFQFEVNAKTQEPLEFQNENFALKVKGGVWLDAYALFNL
ncbi:hypothetical protein RN001_011179 [Aquatica leii]|uniref:Cytochrome P450 n=1 Tax=Aquatica leii TaxID=1421715 RepID=A0AAN7QHZ3_9COLE|nr:hypothetical protein RN001_011179 [Aquatica leii]